MGLARSVPLFEGGLRGFLLKAQAVKARLSVFRASTSIMILMQIPVY